MGDLADVDVLMMTDCRFPGGNSASVHEEVVAQARAGYRTGILHVPSPVLRRPRPFSPKIRRLLDEGLAELVVGRPRIRTRLVLARHPTIFSEPPADLPSIESEAAVLAVNQVPEDDRGVRPYYDVARVAANIERVLGRPAVWAPIGPRVRDSLAGLHDVVGLADTDWENVIDVAAWHVDRTGFVGERPVIGRHSRGHWSKWPDRVDDILDAYPDDPRYAVSVLGGIDAPARLLGHVPDNWVDHPFDSIPAPQFLAEIDFFVYFHHPGLIEAFGRVVLEAMSAGAVCIVPPYLERLFGDVCLYGQPADVRRYVDEYWGDWTRYAERSQRGIELARERFSYETHVGRVASLIGPPAIGVEPPTGRPAPIARRVSELTMVVDLDSTEPIRPAAHSSVVGSATGITKAARGIDDVLVVETASGDQPAAVRAELLPRVVRDLPDSGRADYLGERVSELVEAHRPRHVVLLSGSLPPARVIGARLDGSGISVWAVVAGSSDGFDGVPPLPAELLDAIPAGTTIVDITPREGVTHAGTGAGHRGPSPTRGRSSIRRARGMLAARVEAAKPRLSPAVRRVRAVEARVRRLAVRVTGRSGVHGVDGGSLRWPVSGRCTHPRPSELPVVLVVVTSDAGTRGRDAVVAAAVRQEVTSAFQPCFLLPPDLEPLAHRHRLLCETLLTEQQWSDLHGHGWHGYLRTRLAAARRTFDALSVVFADGATGGEVAEALDAISQR